MLLVTFLFKAFSIKGRPWAAQLHAGSSPQVCAKNVQGFRTRLRRTSHHAMILQAMMPRQLQKRTWCPETCCFESRHSIVCPDLGQHRTMGRLQAGLAMLASMLLSGWSSALSFQHKSLGDAAVQHSMYKAGRAVLPPPWSLEAPCKAPMAWNVTP